MNTHKVNIFIPLYNAEKTIGDTIKSLLLQSYDNFDLIISDNHSSDNSLKIINAFNDKRIKLYLLMILFLYIQGIDAY